MTGEDPEDSSPYVTARGMLYLTGGHLSGTISGAIFFIFIARFLPSVSDLGFVTGIQTVIAFWVILSSLGLARSATRFISTNMGAGELLQAKRIFTLIFRIGLVSSVFFSAVLYLISPYISDILFHDQKYVHLIQLSCFDVFLYSMCTFLMFLLYATQKFKEVTVILIVNSLVKFPASLILLLMGMGLDGIILGLIIGDAITTSLYMRALWPMIKRGTAGRSDLKPMLNYAKSLYGSMILNFLSTKIDIYLLLFLSSLYAVGIYSPAVFIVTTFSLVLGTLDQALLPYTARIFGKTGLNSLGSSAVFVTRYLFLIYIPLGFIIAAIIPKLIVILLGPRFYDSIYSTVLLVLVMAVTSMLVVFNNILRSAEYTGIVMKADAIALPLQVIVAVGAIPTFGALGAAIARSTSRVVSFIYISYRLKRIMGLPYDRQALKVGLVGSCIMSVIIYAVDSLLVSVYYLPLNLGFGIMIYALILRITRTVESKDIHFIDNVTGRKLKWLTNGMSKILIANSSDYSKTK